MCVAIEHGRDLYVRVVGFVLFGLMEGKLCGDDVEGGGVSDKKEKVSKEHKVATFIVDHVHLTTH